MRRKRPLVLEQNSAKFQPKQATSEVKKAMLKLKARLEAKHQRQMADLRQKLEREHSRALDEFRMQHLMDLENENKHFSTQIANLRTELVEKVTNMENEFKAVLEANHIGKDAGGVNVRHVATSQVELARTQVVEQDWRLARCICCGDILKCELFCTKKCLHMW